jgi:hypothetical protein
MGQKLVFLETMSAICGGSGDTMGTMQLPWISRNKIRRIWSFREQSRQNLIFSEAKRAKSGIFRSKKGKIWYFQKQKEQNLVFPEAKRANSGISRNKMNFETCLMHIDRAAPGTCVCCKSQLY